MGWASVSICGRSISMQDARAPVASTSTSMVDPPDSSTGGGERASVPSPSTLLNSPSQHGSGCDGGPSMPDVGEDAAAGGASAGSARGPAFLARLLPGDARSLNVTPSVGASVLDHAHASVRVPLSISSRSLKPCGCDRLRPPSCAIRQNLSTEFLAWTNDDRSSQLELQWVKYVIKARKRLTCLRWIHIPSTSHNTPETPGVTMHLRGRNEAAVPRLQSSWSGETRAP